MCLTCYKVSLCYNAMNHYLNPLKTQMDGGSAPTQQKNFASGKNQEFAKHSGISQMILADCLWSDVEALSV